MNRKRQSQRHDDLASQEQMTPNSCNIHIVMLCQATGHAVDPQLRFAPLALMRSVALLGGGKLKLQTSQRASIASMTQYKEL